jgi:hypothetical protein
VFLFFLKLYPAFRCIFLFFFEKKDKKDAALIGAMAFVFSLKFIPIHKFYVIGRLNFKKCKKTFACKYLVIRIKKKRLKKN